MARCGLGRGATCAGFITRTAATGPGAPARQRRSAHGQRGWRSSRPSPELVKVRTWFGPCLLALHSLGPDLPLKGRGTDESRRAKAKLLLSGLDDARGGGRGDPPRPLGLLDPAA